jgi:hypothetical protein
MTNMSSGFSVATAELCAHASDVGRDGASYANCTSGMLLSVMPLEPDEPLEPLVPLEPEDPLDPSAPNPLDPLVPLEPAPASSASNDVASLPHPLPAAMTASTKTEQRDRARA